MGRRGGAAWLFRTLGTSAFPWPSVFAVTGDDFFSPLMVFALVLRPWLGAIVTASATGRKGVSGVGEEGDGSGAISALAEETKSVNLLRDFCFLGVVENDHPLGS